jgi:cyclic beta-1,2-glucan synthetase
MRSPAPLRHTGGWLLDNFHLVEALQQIHEGVPRRYYADLPKLNKLHLSRPSAYKYRLGSVAHTGSVDPHLFTAS